MEDSKKKEMLKPLEELVTETMRSRAMIIASKLLTSEEVDAAIIETENKAKEKFDNKPFEVLLIDSLISMIEKRHLLNEKNKRRC